MVFVVQLLIKSAIFYRIFTTQYDYLLFCLDFTRSTKYNICNNILSFIRPTDDTICSPQWIGSCQRLDNVCILDETVLYVVNKNVLNQTSNHHYDARLKFNANEQHN